MYTLQIRYRHSTRGSSLSLAFLYGTSSHVFGASKEKLSLPKLNIIHFFTVLE